MLLLLGPLVLGLVALIGASVLWRAPKHGEQTPRRLLVSYLCLLPAFGVGTCYAAVFSSPLPEGPAPAIPLVIAIGCAAAAAFAVVYITKVRALPDLHRRIEEAFEVPAREDRRSLVTLILGVLAWLIAGASVLALLSYLR